jgi:hypothetical protein
MPRQQNHPRKHSKWIKGGILSDFKSFLKCEFCSVLKFEKIFQIQRLLYEVNLILLINKSRTLAEQAHVPLRPHSTSLNQLWWAPTELDDYVI